MASPAVLKIDIIADATKALKQMGMVEDKAEGGLGFTKTAKAIAGAVGTGALLKFGKEAADAAAADAEAAATLAQTLRNVTGATDAQIASTEKWISGLSKTTAIADDDLRPALDQLVRGFGNTADAQKALALATDVAAGTGKDLTSVTEAMMKAANGQTGALGRMGIKTTDAAGKALSLNEIMAEMAKTFGGQAAASADSVAGKVRNAQIQFGELQETIGAALLPVLAELAPLLTKIAGFIADNAGWIAPLVAGVVGLVAALKVWTVVQTALNLVMSANPIALVVLAIAALVAGVIVAYQKVGWFRDLCDTAFRAVATAFGWITDAAKKVFSWIAEHWPLLVGILGGPFAAAALLIIKNWDSVVGFFKGLIGKIGDIASSIADALKAPINAFIRAWNAIEFKIPSIDLPGVGKIGGSTIGLPDIPTLATGGSVLRTGLAIVHEGEQFSGVGRGFGQTTINIHVTTTGLGADSPQIQRGIVDALRAHTSRNGPLDIAVRTA